MENDQYTRFEEQAKRLGDSSIARSVSDEDGRYFARASDQILDNVRKAQRILNEERQYVLLGCAALEMYKLVKYKPEERREFIETLKFALGRLAQDNPELGLRVPVEFKQEAPIKIKVIKQ